MKFSRPLSSFFQNLKLVIRRKIMIFLRMRKIIIFLRIIIRVEYCEDVSNMVLPNIGN